MKSWIRSVIAISVGIVTMLVASVTTLVDDIEYRVSDLWLQIRGADAPPPGVVVIAIDEASYRELNVPYGPPWPRGLHAKLLHKLHELGAKRVVFDVLFVGPGADPQSDQELAEGLALLPSVIGVEASMRYIQKQGGGYMIEDLEQPFEPFRKAAKEALIGLRERQGVIRSFPLARSDQERKFPFLAYAGAGLFNSNAAGLAFDQFARRKVEAIYWFADFADPIVGPAAEEAAKLVLDNKMEIIIHSTRGLGKAGDWIKQVNGKIVQTKLEK